MRKENSTNMINQLKMEEICGTANALSVISGRWKATILQLLLHKKMRYSQLKNFIPNISDRMLALQLKELEQHGVIKKEIYAEVPVRVEYELTEAGMEMKALLNCLSDWGRKYKKQTIAP